MTVSIITGLSPLSLMMNQCPGLSCHSGYNPDPHQHLYHYKDLCNSLQKYRAWKWFTWGDRNLFACNVRPIECSEIQHVPHNVMHLHNFIVFVYKTPEVTRFRWSAQLHESIPEESRDISSTSCYLWVLHLGSLHSKVYRRMEMCTHFTVLDAQASSFRPLVLFRIFVGLRRERSMLLPHDGLLECCLRSASNPHLESMRSVRFCVRQCCQWFWL